MRATGPPRCLFSTGQGPRAIARLSLAFATAVRIDVLGGHHARGADRRDGALLLVLLRRPNRVELAKTTLHGSISATSRGTPACRARASLASRQAPPSLPLATASQCPVAAAPWPSGPTRYLGGAQLSGIWTEHSLLGVEAPHLASSFAPSGCSFGRVVHVTQSILAISAPDSYNGEGAVAVYRVVGVDSV